jgi:ankyrin repeat protein
MAISYRAAQSLIKRGDEAALRTALEQGLNANLANENGWTLLMLAAVEGSVPVGRLLLESSANKAAANAKGDTAESIATNRGFAEFVALLQA